MLTTKDYNIDFFNVDCKLMVKHRIDGTKEAPGWQAVKQSLASDLSVCMVHQPSGNKAAWSRVAEVKQMTNDWLYYIDDPFCRSSNIGHNIF